MKELQLRYHYPTSLFLTIYPYYGNLNSVPQQQSSLGAGWVELGAFVAARRQWIERPIKDEDLTKHIGSLEYDMVYCGMV